jgi:hypothetical protein
LIFQAQINGITGNKDFLSTEQLASKLHKEDEDILVATMGKEADNLLKSFELSESNAKKYGTVLTKFDEHFNPKKNTIHERAKFHKRNKCQVKQYRHSLDLYTSWRTAVNLPPILKASK